MAKRRKQSQRNSLQASTKATANWITLERQKNNLAVYQLALKMGIATSLVQAWEDGICEPTLALKLFGQVEASGHSPAALNAMRPDLDNYTLSVVVPKFKSRLAPTLLG